MQVGDTVTVGSDTLEIAGMLKYNPFSENGSTNGKITLITSGETFKRVTGVVDYSLIMVQTTKDATDKDVTASLQCCRN